MKGTDCVANDSAPRSMVCAKIEYQGTVIYFQTKPDAVFEAILEEALLSEMTEVKMLADDGAIDSWEGLYPESSSAFGPYTAIRLMAQLLAATRDASVYHLTDVPWLVLYECLQNFCATHNDLVEDDPQGSRAIGAFRIGRVDGEAIVTIYFWDTDFLLRPMPNDRDTLEHDEFVEEPVDEGAQESSEDSVGNAVLPLEIVEEVAWIVPQAGAFFRTGSIEYPDTRA